MPNTFTLGLEDYTRNDEDLRQPQAKQDLTDDLSVIDTFAAHLTASFVTHFRASASFAGVSGPMGSNIAIQDRTITNVIAWAEASGSGAGVTTVDILKQFDAVGGFHSIFAGVNANKVAISSSLGNYGQFSVTSFVSGVLPTWQAGKILRADMTTTVPLGGNNAQMGVNVLVFWKPSGSYGSGG